MKRESDMKFIVEIEINNGHPSIDMSPEMPFILADKIKDIVNEFYKSKR